ncbi:MAG TPA: hypothetical protein VHB49_18445, partial [Bradyrhizobium sp.]|nr:hypothetical protein [Bradyrhizobium sp.]
VFPAPSIFEGRGSCITRAQMRGEIECVYQLPNRGHPSRRGEDAVSQDAVVTRRGTTSDPHGEERGNAVRLEP